MSSRVSPAPGEALPPLPDPCPAQAAPDNAFPALGCYRIDLARAGRAWPLRQEGAHPVSYNDQGREATETRTAKADSMAFLRAASVGVRCRRPSRARGA